MRFRNTSTFAVLLATAILMTFGAGVASGKIYGTKPLVISAATDGSSANGNSGQPAVSGDNRVSKYIAFYSDASNIAAGDNNGVRDVFVWTRPRGSAGEKLNVIGIGGPLKIASVASDGSQANGPSEHPHVDGSMKAAPKCVTFQSQATNLNGSDATPDWDIYVRNLKTNKTYLASAGVAGDATRPALNGNCTEVVYEAGGSVYRAKSRGWALGAGAANKSKRVGAGSQIRISLEGTSIAWVAPGGAIKWQTAGRGARTVGNGSGPWVSDKDRKAGWGITFQSGDTVISRKITRKLKLATRARITGAVFGGSTVYVPNRGIINYAKGKSFYYFNANTGNSDDLAHANSNITEMGLGARGTTMVFAAEGGDADFIDTPLFQGPAVIDPNAPPTVAPTPTLPKPVRFQSIYVKVLPTVGCGSGC